MQKFVNIKNEKEKQKTEWINTMFSHRKFESQWRRFYVFEQRSVNSVYELEEHDYLFKNACLYIVCSFCHTHFVCIHFRKRRKSGVISNSILEHILFFVFVISRGIWLKSIYYFYWLYYSFYCALSKAMPT